MYRLSDRPDTRTRSLARKAALALVVMAGVGAGCGGGATSSPTVASPVVAPTPLSVAATLDGITGATVRAQVQPGDPVAVSADGYLTRRQPLSSTVWLWPQTEDYVKATVYSSGDFCMIRWAEGSTLRLAFAAGLSRYDGFLAEMAAEAARWSQLPVIALPAGDQTANVTFAVDPAANVDASALALTYRTYAAGSCRIIGALVTFREARNIDGGQRNNTLLHEIGHVLGLAHSPDPNDVMSVDAKRTNDRAFGGQERLALTMMYVRRKAGNIFPDTERAGLTSLAMTPIVDVTACR